MDKEQFEHFLNKDPLDAISFNMQATNIEYNSYPKGKPNEEGHLFTFEGKRYIVQVKQIEK